VLLKALADHAPHVDGLPPAGYRTRTVRWAILIDAHGAPLSRGADGRPALDDLAGPDHRNGIALEAPYVYRSGAKPPPLLLVDTLQYVLAVPKEPGDKAEREAARRNSAYIDLLREWAAATPADPTATAVLAFFTSDHHRRIAVPAHAKPTDNVALRVHGHEGWPHLGEAAQRCWSRTVAARKSGRTGTGLCLSCGTVGTLLDTLPQSVKSGAIPAGNGRARDAQLVSVNTTAQGRGGRIQLADIPVCDHCGTQSTAVLNTLLADPEHRHRTDDAVTVWWLKEPASFSPLRLLEQPRPDQVAALYRELDRARARPADAETNRFYALTLSANQSRVVVREWLDIPLERSIAHITAWFEDHRMQDVRTGELRYAPRWLMEYSLGRGTTDGDTWRYLGGSQPVYAGPDLLHCALRGPTHRPPERLLQRLLQRIRADGHIDHTRAALLRLLLIRRNPAERTRLMPRLNVDDARPALVCGRIFAVLEEIQYYALRDPTTKKGPNTTITDRYFKQAAVAPLSQLVRLRMNANGHLKRLRRDNGGAATALSDRLHELFDLLPDGPPVVLDLHGQGLFVVGYHQQRAHSREAQRGNRPDSTEENE
jgi:CRISPR-associated protein Csd1